MNKGVLIPSDIGRELAVDKFVENKLATRCGVDLFRNVIKNLDVNEDSMHLREQKITRWVTNRGDLTICRNVLKEKVSQLETPVTWALKPREEHSAETQELLKNVYFEWGFMNNKLLLGLFYLFSVWATPIIAVGIPIISLLISAFVVNVMGWGDEGGIWGNMTKIMTALPAASQMIGSLIGHDVGNIVTPIVGLVWLGGYLYSAWDTVSKSKKVHDTFVLLSKNVDDLQNVNMHAKWIAKKDPTCSPHFIKSLEDAENRLSTAGMYYPFNIGVKAAILEAEKQYADHYFTLFNYIAEIDLITTVSELVIDEGWTIPNIDFEADKPYIKVSDMFHPSITNPIKNDIDIERGLIVTGANMAGKSSYIRGVGSIVLLGQNLGAVPARTCSFSVFHMVCSHLSIVDAINSESLFEAELNRCNAFSEAVRNIGNDKFVLGIMDEIFTATNEMEGEAAAIAYCEELNKNKNCITIVTTHMQQLPQYLEEAFDNKKFEAHRASPKQKWVFDYKLQDGVSTQHIALDIMKQKGVNTKLTRNARHVLKKLINNARVGA